MAFKFNPLTGNLDYYELPTGFDGEAESAPGVTPGTLGNLQLWLKSDTGVTKSTETSSSNLVANGDFETGDLTSWSLYGTPTTAVELTGSGGSYSLHLTTGAGANGIQQNLSGIDNSAYTGYVLVVRGYIVSGTLGVYSVDAALNVLKSTPTGSWFTYTLNFHPTTASPYNIILYGSNASEIYIDSIYIVPQPNMVSQWVDQSDAGVTWSNTLAVGYGQRWPIYQANSLNGYPAIVFDGVDDFLRGTLTSTSPRSVFIVAKFLSGTPSVSDAFFQSVPAAYGIYVQKVAGSKDTFGWWDGYSWPEANKTGEIYQLYELIMNGALESKSYVNGAVVKEFYLQNHMGDNSLYDIGGQGGSRSNNAEVVEITIFDEAMTDARRQQAESYFNTRYSLW